MKKLVLRSTRVLAPIVAGGATIGMIVDIGSQIASGATDNLLTNVAGWLAFLAFIAFIWHATILQIESAD